MITNRDFYGLVGKNKTQEIKAELNLFSELYVATQVLGGDMDEFFCHETLSYPPSLSTSGSSRSGEKSGMLSNLKGLVRSNTELEAYHDIPIVDAIVVDGPVVVNQITPKKNQIFSKYAEDVLYPYLVKYQSRANANRLDVVFDTYPEISLKGVTRSKRGSGIRRKVNSNSVTPTNWKEFLRSSANKTELFRFLSLSCGNIICAYDDTVTNLNNTMYLSPSDHEEPDTRVSCMQQIS